MNKKKYCYEYPRPSVSADCVVFGYKKTESMVLLIERAFEPYKGQWAFPGGFMEMEETTDECAQGSQGKGGYGCVLYTG